MKESHQVLIEKYLSDRANETELEEISGLISTSPVFRQALQDAQRIRGLCEIANEEDSDIWNGIDNQITEMDNQAFNHDTMTAIKKLPNRRRFRYTLMAAAAINILVFGLLFYYLKQTQQTVRAIAFANSSTPESLIIRNGQKVNINAATEIYPGDQLQSTEKSTIKINYPDASIITLSPDSKVNLKVSGKAKKIELLSGQLHGSINKQIENMEIVTRHSKIEIIGTRFTVNTDSESTVLTVHEGKVKHTDLVSLKSEFVETNESIMVDNQPQKLEKVALASPQFVSPLIQSKSDLPVNVIVDVSKAKKLYLIVESTDGNSHFDSGVWHEGYFETASGKINLSELKWLEGHTSWRHISKTYPAKGTIKFNQAVLDNVIFAHANSMVVYDIPPGSKYFKVRCVINDDQRRQSINIKFKVYTDMGDQEKALFIDKIKKSRIGR